VSPETPSTSPLLVKQIDYCTVRTVQFCRSSMLDTA
jgi:hypothetical protein